jgi:hypothetical protein
METIGPIGSLAPVYVGQSRLLHYWPWCTIAVSILALAAGSVGGALFFVVLALVFGGSLPWRFDVFGSGIALWFGFGKRRFLRKENITLRVGLGSTLVLRRGANRFGYTLTDGLGEHRGEVLRSVLAEHGFDITT